MINHYFYSGQLRSYLKQFCYVFAGLRTMTGIGECNETEFISVPIVIGSKDRVVAALNAGNTLNKPPSIPMMAVHLSGLELNPSARKGVGVADKHVHLPAGGVYPDDLRIITRLMPQPYLASIDLAIYASNTEQLHQILEQILPLFDPTLTIQLSTNAFDWTKLTYVELTNIMNDENYPAGTDRRIINWTLSFRMPIYLSFPVDIRDEMVRTIFIQLGDLEGFSVDEVGADGELLPFKEQYGDATVIGEVN